MATAAQELAVHEKKELVSKEEKTVPGRYYIPYTDIHETDEALTVVMEMPGVEKKDINVSLENDVLRVDGQIDFAKYEGMEPVYTEYKCWALHAVLHAVQQDRSGEDQCAARGRGAHTDAAEGKGSSAAADFDRMT